MEMSHGASSHQQMRLAPTSHQVSEHFSMPASTQVHDVQRFSPVGPRVRAKAGGNLQSYAFQFYNADIAHEHGLPQSHAKETFGQFYGGNIGAQ